MRISDWSSDVCSSDLSDRYPGSPQWAWESEEATHTWLSRSPSTARQHHRHGRHGWAKPFQRSEEHTSEFQALMRISYAVFCLTTTIPRAPHNYRPNTSTNIKYHDTHQNTDTHS